MLPIAVNCLIQGTLSTLVLASLRNFYLISQFISPCNITGNILPSLAIIWYMNKIGGAMRIFFAVFIILTGALLLNIPSTHSQSTNTPQLMTLKGTFGLGEGDVTSTIYVGNDAYDIYFPDGMEDKQREMIEKLVNMCSASKNKICEIVCLVQKAPKDDEFYGYITDIKSIKPLQ